MPIFASGDLEMLVAAFRARERGNDGDNTSHKFKPSVLWAGRHLATKDDGLFDNSPWEWVDKGGEGGGEGGGGGAVAAATTVATAAAVARSAAAAAEAKKEAYNAFVFGRNVDPSKFSSPYALMLHVVRVVVGAVVLELLIDEEDSPRGPGITFGPVVLLQEDPHSSFPPGSASRRKLVDCLLDEVIGLSLAQDRPIKMPLDLYDATVRVTRVVGREYYPEPKHTSKYDDKEYYHEPKHPSKYSADEYYHEPKYASKYDADEYYNEPKHYYNEPKHASKYDDKEYYHEPKHASKLDADKYYNEPKHASKEDKHVKKDEKAHLRGKKNDDKKEKHHDNEGLLEKGWKKAGDVKDGVLDSVFDHDHHSSKDGKTTYMHGNHHNTNPYPYSYRDDSFSRGFEQGRAAGRAQVLAEDRTQGRGNGFGSDHGSA
eukprot:evm.model.NODE_12607_length_16021_cov_57.992634.4